MMSDVLRKAAEDAGKHKCQVVYCGEVTKIHDRQGQDARILVVTDVFIAFYRMKKTPIRDRTMYWPYITSMSVFRDSVNLEFSGEHMRFITPNSEVVVEKIVNTLQRILTCDELKSLGIERLIKRKLAPNGRGLIARFKGYCGRAGITKMEPLLRHIKKMAISKSPVLDLSKLDGVGMLLPFLFRSLGTVDYLESIVLPKSDRNDVTSAIAEYLRYPFPLKHIGFNNYVPFNFPTVINQMCENERVTLTGMSFYNYGFLESDLIAVQKLASCKRLASLTIHNAMNPGTAPILYQNFWNEQIHGSLRMINFNRTKDLNVPRLLAVIPNVYSISFAYCNLDVAQTVMDICDSKSLNLTYLNLSGNFCSTKISEMVKFPKHFKRIDVDDIDWKNDTLTPFVQGLMKYDWTDGLELSISKIKTSEKELDRLFAYFGSLQRTPLVKLVWNENRVTASLFKAIRVSQHLQTLAMCGSIDNGNVAQLVEHTENLPILSNLVIRGSVHVSVSNIRPVIEKLGRIKNMRFVDLSMNNICKRDLTDLVKAASSSRCISSVKFDNCGIQEISDFADIVGTVGSRTRPLYISWPFDDIDKLIRHHANRQEQLENLILRIRKAAMKNVTVNGELPLDRPFECPITEMDLVFPDYFTSTLVKYLEKSDASFNSAFLTDLANISCESSSAEIFMKIDQKTGVHRLSIVDSSSGFDTFDTFDSDDSRNSKLVPVEVNESPLVSCDTLQGNDTISLEGAKKHRTSLTHGAFGFDEFCESDDDSETEGLQKTGPFKPMQSSVSKPLILLPAPNPLPSKPDSDKGKNISHHSHDFSLASESSQRAPIRLPNTEMEEFTHSDESDMEFSSDGQSPLIKLPTTSNNVDDEDDCMEFSSASEPSCGLLKLPNAVGIRSQSSGLLHLPSTVDATDSIFTLKGSIEWDSSDPDFKTAESERKEILEDEQPNVDIVMNDSRSREDIHVHSETDQRASSTLDETIEQKMTPEEEAVTTTNNMDQNVSVSLVVEDPVPYDVCPVTSNTQEVEDVGPMVTPEPESAKKTTKRKFLSDSSSDRLASENIRNKQIPKLVKAPSEAEQASSSQSSDFERDNAEADDDWSLDLPGVPSKPVLNHSSSDDWTASLKERMVRRGTYGTKREVILVSEEDNTNDNYNQHRSNAYISSSDDEKAESSSAINEEELLERSESSAFGNDVTEEADIHPPLVDSSSSSCDGNEFKPHIAVSPEKPPEVDVSSSSDNETIISTQRIASDSEPPPCKPFVTEVDIFASSDDSDLPKRRYAPEALNSVDFSSFQKPMEAEATPQKSKIPRKNIPSMERSRIEKSYADTNRTPIKQDKSPVRKIPVKKGSSALRRMRELWNSSDSDEDVRKLLDVGRGEQEQKVHVQIQPAWSVFPIPKMSQVQDNEVLENLKNDIDAILCL